MQTRPSVPDRFRVGIARLKPTDADDLATFQRSMFGEDARQLDADRWAWLFDHNPARQGDEPGLWVCRRNEAIVGQQAEIPFEAMVDGARWSLAWGIDLMVDPAWRLRGVGPGLVATQLEAHDIVVGMTQAAEAFKSYMRGGWADVGLVPVYVRPLDARRFLRVAPVPARLRRFAPVAGPAVRAADALASTVLRGVGARLVEVDRFDERVDEVWSAAAADYSVIAVRDAETTRWRLDDRPDADRLRRFYLEKGGRTIGYVAFRPLERWGDQAAFVVDVLAPRRWLAPLLTMAGVEARREGAFALVCRLMCEPADRALQAAGFVRRGVGVSAPLHLILHSIADDQVTNRLADSASWYLTAADSDLS